MARIKGKATVKTIQKQVALELNKQEKLNERDEFGKPLYLQCKCCNKIKPIKEYYACYSPSNKTGYTYLCKDCMSMISLNLDGKFDKNKVFELVKTLDKPFINRIFETVDSMVNAKKTGTIAEKSKIGIYLKMVNSFNGGYRNSGFENSEEIQYGSTEEENKSIEKQKTEDLDLWGEGFSENEYKQLNKKYNLLLNNYPLRTEMHKEMLVKYCKYSLREELAIAQGNTNDAKYWGELAMKTATNAKINPSQLSAADLSDGMTCFSQLSAVVEKAVDIIPLLPQFVEEPKDRVDYTMWEYINYARHLNGKPLCEYKDIYKFLNKRYESLKKRYKFLKEESDGRFDTDDIDSE